MTNEQITKVAALAGAVLLLLSTTMAVTAVAPTVDTETTDTVTTTALNDGATVTFTANSSKNISTLQASYDSQNPEVRVRNPETGRVVETYVSSDMVQTGSASGTYYYNLTANQGDLEYFEIDAGESANSTWQIVNNSEVDDPDLTNITVTLEESANRTVRVVGDQPDELETSSTWSIGSFSLPLLSSTNVDYSGESLPTADGGKVIVHASNESLVNDIDSLSSNSAESLVTGLSVKANGEFVPMYVKSAPSDVSGDYAVIKPGTSNVVYHSDSNENVDLSVSTSGIGVWKSALVTVFGSYNFPLSVGGMASSAGLLLFAGRRSLRDRWSAGA